MLLTQCQVEFEKDTSKKVQEMIAGIENKEERDYQAALVKKNYLGHMRFIGELYKNDMIKIDIMLWCLKTLLEDDEEQLECFVKLMTTSGGSLEQQALALEAAGKPASWEQLQECWTTVGQFATKGPSSRIKFMLQGLLELRDNGTYENVARRIRWNAGFSCMFYTAIFLQQAGWNVGRKKQLRRLIRFTRSLPRRNVLVGRGEASQNRR